MPDDENHHLPYHRTEVDHMPPTARDTPESNAPQLSFNAAAPYRDYGNIDTLHSLQQPRTSHPTERDFILTTQVMELLFHTLIHRWEHARDALETNDVEQALGWLRRATHAQDVLVDSWQLLADLQPAEFAQFRDALGSASGFHSHTYRHLEFLLGNKSAAMIRPHQDSPHIRAQLESALAQPSLYDAALGLLARRGMDIPREVTDRDLTQPYQPHPDVQHAWHSVYHGHHPDLIHLAEALLDTAERATRWRQRHLMAVKRVLGNKPGTGGSSGLEWLTTAAHSDVFPDLWSVRTIL